MTGRHRRAKRHLADLSRDTFGSLRVRNFRLFFVGQGISQIGNWLTLVAQTLLVLKITDDGVAVGVVTACQFVPILLIGAWVGLIADRSDKRKLLLVVQGFAMVQSFALAALAFSDHPPVEALYAVALLGGIAFAFDNPTRRAFVTEMVSDDLVHNAVSLNSAMMTTARVIGPALAGLLITTVGYGWCFAVDGASYVGAIIALGLIRRRELRPPVVAQRASGQIRDGLRYMWHEPQLKIPLLMLAVIGTLAFNFQVVFPLLVTRTFDGNEATFTILFSVISLGSLVGALATARRTTIAIRDVVLAAGAFGVSMSVFAFAPGLAWTFPLGLVVGATSVWLLTTSTAILQVNAAPDMRGRILALQSIVFLGTTPIGGPLLGWFSDAVTPRAAILLGGLASCAAAVWGWQAAQRRGAFTAREPEPADVTVPEPA
jgi:MFS family permease